MANVKHLPRKKAALNEKLKGLTVQTISETTMSMLGLCGKEHVINTNLSREQNEILAGEFLTSPYDKDKIWLCVGKGEICSAEHHDIEVLWFLDIELRGIHCLGENNLKELRKAHDSVELVIV